MNRSSSSGCPGRQHSHRNLIFPKFAQLWTAVTFFSVNGFFFETWIWKCKVQFVHFWGFYGYLIPLAASPDPKRAVARADFPVLRLSPSHYEYYESAKYELQTPSRHLMSENFNNKIWYIFSLENFSTKNLPKKYFSSKNQKQIFLRETYPKQSF